MTVFKVSAIILAAGYSGRMEKFKPLLPMGGMSILERSIRLFQTAGIGDIRVVTGHRADELLPLLGQLEIQTIFNKHYEEGMFSSVKAGLETLNPGHCEAFFILPADLPMVSPDTVIALLNAYYADRGGDILHPSFQGKRGHPPLISICHAGNISAWKRGGGLRAFLSQHEDRAMDVPVPDEYILADLDTPGDYDKMLCEIRE
ncbi:MAG: hypothetical protein B6245_00590 [Desulfobacteraceae bacterium 4572_88]|nr:MAG: hypothetical protein B6245_00590 [Desulfobacteraceae bacterium 4572_88]